MPQAKIGVIGGTGLYDIAGLTGIEELDITTPFGRPSGAITVGNLEGVGVAFLPRHGKGHRLLPGELPVRANIYALKSLGVERIIAVNSAGSFKEEIKPGDLLIPDQLIDRTRGRVDSFFGEGIAAHIAFAEPFCPVMRTVLFESAASVGANVHPRGTYLVMEGPAFSTRAESRLYRSWGADIIGMTALPEARLAREAEICYAVIGCVTDYDSWHESNEPVTIDMIISTLSRNVAAAREIIALAVAGLPDKRDCDCAHALETAIVTSPELIPTQQKERLKLIIGKYIS
ncbi:MAG: S-methyl-5'-thioadenosine phosphorylase [Chloroflexota bacterium]